ncbi:MAG: substrate-binding periplasmic protein [Campylobacterales bacterium]
MKKLIAIITLVISMHGSQFLIMTEDLKPYNYKEDGKLKGISVEVVEKVLENLGYKDEEIIVYPWSRAINVLQTNKKAILFSMSYTQERAQKYKFACPLSEVEVFFFVRKDSEISLQELNDIKDLKVGVVQDFGAHKHLVKKGFSDFDYSSSTKVMAQKLLSKKIDAFAAAPFAVYSLDIDTSNIEQTPLKLYGTDLCIAFNKSFDDLEVKKWEDELLKIRQSGQYQKIFDKYIKKD